VSAALHVVESSILPILGNGLAQRVDQFTGTRSEGLVGHDLLQAGVLALELL